MIRDAACKMNNVRVKDLSHSGAMPCNLCLELAHFPLQPHQTKFIQHFPRPASVSNAIASQVHKSLLDGIEKIANHHMKFVEWSQIYYKGK